MQRLRCGACKCPLPKPDLRCRNCGLDAGASKSRRKRELRQGLLLVAFGVSVALVIAIAAPFLRSI